MSKLKGSKTEQNQSDGFAGETLNTFSPSC